MPSIRHLKHQAQLPNPQKDIVSNLPVLTGRELGLIANPKITNLINLELQEVSSAIKLSFLD